MAHIVEFSVEGLAGRKGPYSSVLNRDVNVFFGLNGTGKTSLLKILHSAMSMDASILSDIPFQSASVVIFSRDYNRSFTYNITNTPNEPGTPIRLVFGEETYSRELLRGAQGLEKLPTWKVKPLIKDKDFGAFAHRYLPTSRIWNAPALQSNMLFTTKDASAVSEMQLDKYFQQSLEALWRSYMGKVLAKVSSAQEEGLVNILKGILTSEKSKGSGLDSSTAYQRAKTFLTRQGAQAAIGSPEEFAKRYARNASLKNVVSYINEVETRIDEATAPRDRLQELIGKMFTENKTVRFTDKAIEVLVGNKSAISLASLSSGEKHVLRILIECLFAEENSIIIDEPELSMHIDWQKDLIQAMQSVNPDAQLILATHSPEVMASLEDDKIFRI